MQTSPSPGFYRGQPDNPMENHKVSTDSVNEEKKCPVNQEKSVCFMWFSSRTSWRYHVEEKSGFHAVRDDTLMPYGMRGSERTG